ELLGDGTPVPTPWPKAEFEERQRDFQARRKALRAAGRPESEMNALFREEQAFTTRLLAGAAHAGEVGAFQGANYDARAYYRPQLDCVMFSRDEVPFCRVCSRALEDIIDLHTGATAAR
ncbi:MAG TPA: M64 family metallopeptidase, partial [Steroidobacteraceae bacterium]|nr:M64 family metallopeptidase [Steroidobacteraceae bacterium]